MMNNFIKLIIESGSNIDIAREKIVIEDTKGNKNIYLGQGSRICDIKYPFGGYKEQQNLSVTVNKNKEEVVSINGIPILTRDLEFYEFRFNNLDF